jgi:hypothetical protein
MLAGVAANAQRTTPVTVANTKVDCSTKTVTFDLSWKGSDAGHRNEVWIFADIQPATGSNTLGAWSPATLVSGATTVTPGSGNQYSSPVHTVVSGNTRGVSQDTQERIKVDASDIVNNNPSEVLLRTPALGPGT